MRTMSKEEFIESMMAAKEEEKEYINMADVAKEVKTAVKTGTGKKITRLAEPVKRGRKPGSKNKVKKTKDEMAPWQRHIINSLSAMIAESSSKLDQAGELIEEAEELINHAAALEDMVK